MSAMLPVVVRVAGRLDGIGCKTYRIVGWAVRSDWAAECAKRGAEPSCEFSIWSNSDQLGSYGGEAWPGAWPALFTCHRGSAQSGPYTLLTEVGKQLVREADAAFADAKEHS